MTVREKEVAPHKALGKMHGSFSEFRTSRVVEPCREEARRYPPNTAAGCQNMVSDTFSSWAMARFKGFSGMAPIWTTIPGNLGTVSKQGKTPNEPEKPSNRYSSIFVASTKGNILLLRACCLEYVPFSAILLFPEWGRKVLNPETVAPVDGPGRGDRL